MAVVVVAVVMGVVAVAVVRMGMGMGMLVRMAVGMAIVGMLMSMFMGMFMIQMHGFISFLLLVFSYYIVKLTACHPLPGVFSKEESAKMRRAFALRKDNFI